MIAGQAVLAGRSGRPFWQGCWSAKRAEGVDRVQIPYKRGWIHPVNFLGMKGVGGFERFYSRVEIGLQIRPKMALIGHSRGRSSLNAPKP